MSIDDQIAAKRAEMRGLSDAKAKLNAEIQALRRERWPTKCCRCWPSSIDDKGWCACCDWDHVKGVRETFNDPTPEIE
jgi:hypothetical protein